MFENIREVNCCRLLDTAHINHIAAVSGKYQIFFFLKENSGTFVYNGNWKDIHSYQVFFIFPNEKFTINCNEEDADCFYISFHSPGKIPWNNLDNVIVLQEFRGEFLEMSINLASACLLKDQNSSVAYLQRILQKLDKMITESCIVFATRHFDITHRSFPRHFHMREYQIDYCAVGAGYFFIADHWVEYSPGTFCFIPPHVTHEMLMTQASKIDIYSIKFLIANDSHILRPPDESFAVKVPPESRPEVLLVLKRIVGQSIQDFVISSAMLNKLIAVLHKLKDGQDYLEDDNLLARIKQIMDTGYSFPLKITDIASRLHLSPEHLCRQFKKLSGQTLAAYINSLRLNSSMTMLTNTGMPLKQIAYECGFKNVNYFATLFKKSYAFTPNEVRKKSLRTGNSHKI
jgi:AraC-like DNA-binding protein